MAGHRNRFSSTKVRVNSRNVSKKEILDQVPLYNPGSPLWEVYVTAYELEAESKLGVASGNPGKSPSSR